MLQKKYKLITADFLKINKTGISVVLKKGRSSLLKYENPKTGEIFNVIYNKEKDSCTVAQKPDNILSIYKEGNEKAYEFIFDAKYKIDDTAEYIEKYNGVGPKIEDINTMHRYRDSILYSNKKEGKYENCIFGAFVLFPYKDEENFKNQRFYKSIEEVNIGALPFLPSTTALMEEFLDELINESSYTSFERAIDKVGKDNSLKDEDFKYRNVLVGTLKDVNQLQVNLENNFYHTKKSNLDLIKNKVEYVALSQSVKSFKEDAGILYYGKIKNIKEVKRSEITALPKDSNEIYYVFEVESWNKLYRKIKIEGQAIRRPFYTGKFLLENSRTAAELFIKNKEEFRLFRELTRFYNDVKLKKDNFGEPMYITLGEGIDIIVKRDVVKVIYGDIVESFGFHEFLRNRRRIIRDINN